jgi:flavodoxin
MSKNLIVFYSKADEEWTSNGLENLIVGNTENFAKIIKKYIQADIFKIEPVKDYPKSYKETCNIAELEHDNHILPKIKNKIDISSYDNIFLGYPIWWGDYPMIIQTFIEENDLKNKTIIPFSTNEGSGLCNTDKHLQKELPNSKVLPGFAIYGSQVKLSEDKISKWVKSLNL